ncbi:MULTISPECIES: hypothetical protein [Bacillus]|uniref:hypothetical protein n=1 Tax=Bacillus TaxID=1386 RepID=UPI000BEF5880|nr:MULTISPECIES: hypothetical protein [Bacillus cereus group]MBJ8044279.1 hypothetical protein [Bacillus cereus group sp. N17]PEJ00651.1 hypothetical protein CN671_19405 [Bacillus toyonensis]PFZ67555.1 hypothetical protein COL72_28450 [Bacillus toyonensis]HDR3908618.1 hypothetical protein [Bacillus toyonensis]HDR7409226.1 hypothetical protein [Bacillus toyonensis]
MRYSKPHSKKNSVKITTGPFHVPLEVDSELQVGRDNDRLVITLQNPTHKKLEAFIKLTVCSQPEMEEHDDCKVRVFENIPEQEVNLGTYVLKPYSCTRIERNIPGAIQEGVDERGAIYRITAQGDFMICKEKCEPTCGLLEISVVCGSICNPFEFGLEQADPVTFFRYKDFITCEC